MSGAGDRPAIVQREDVAAVDGSGQQIAQQVPGQRPAESDQIARSLAQPGQEASAA